MREKIIQAIEKEKIIAIVRGVEEEKLIPLAEAMYEGGIRLIEVTYSANSSVSDEKTAGYIKKLVNHFDGRMYVGAGTVLSQKQVKLTKKAGGQFIISPDTNVDVIKKTRRLGMVSLPGALTPTEVQTAHRAGADFIKLFPTENINTKYIKAIKAPLSHVKLLAVGGVNENNMTEFLEAGVCGFGIGSNIVDKKLLANNDFESLASLAKRYTALVK